MRKTNEDTFFCDSRLSLLIVADGMGGHNAGEVASELAVATVRDFISVTQGEREFTWPFGVDQRLSYDSNRLATAVRLANRRVFKEGDTRDKYTGMGTTLVVALVNAGQVTFVNVGDSRLYSFHEGALRQLTTDQTLVAALLQQDPQLSAAQLANHPMRHVLTNVVGAREEVTIDAREHALADGETLLLCTDGLTDLVSDEQIAGALAADDDLAAGLQRLQDAALAAGGEDNLTAVLARYRASQGQ